MGRRLLFTGAPLLLLQLVVLLCGKALYSPGIIIPLLLLRGFHKIAAVGTGSEPLSPGLLGLELLSLSSDLVSDFPQYLCFPVGSWLGSCICPQDFLIVDLLAYLLFLFRAI